MMLENEIIMVALVAVVLARVAVIGGARDFHG